MRNRIVFGVIAAVVLAIGTSALVKAQNGIAAPIPAIAKKINLLIITGDHQGHDWKARTEMFQKFLPKDRFQITVTTTPTIDLNTANLMKYDVLLLNYKQSQKPPPDTIWNDDNKAAFLRAVTQRGLVVDHWTDSTFVEWLGFEHAIGGGWRGQGTDVRPHRYYVDLTKVDHPITRGLSPRFRHSIDELYINPVMFPDNIVLATAYADPARMGGSGIVEPLVWVKMNAHARAFIMKMGHDPWAMSSPGYQALMMRGIEWAATGQVTIPIPPNMDAPVMDDPNLPPVIMVPQPKPAPTSASAGAPPGE